MKLRRAKARKFRFHRGQDGRGDPPGDASEPVREDRTEPVRRRIWPYKSIRKARKIYGFTTESDPTVRSWMEKFPEVQKFERARPLKRLLMGGAVAAVVWSVYTGRPMRGTVFLAFVAAALVIYFDACYLLSRVLADTTRALISASLLGWATVVCWPTTRNMGLATFGSILAIAYIGTLNMRALAAQVYRRSPTVKKALAKAQPAPLEALYQMTGAAQVRTILWELGVSVEEIQATALKAVWVCGYSLSCQMSNKMINEVDELWRKSEALEAELAKRDQLIDETVEFYRAKEDYDKRVEELERALAEAGEELAATRRSAHESVMRVIELEERAENQETQLGRQEEQLAAQAQQIEDLEAELAEANGKVQELEPPPQVVAMPTKSHEQLLAEGAALGMTVDKLMAYAGVTHHRAQTYYAAHKDEIMAARAAVKEA